LSTNAAHFYFPPSLEQESDGVMGSYSLSGNNERENGKDPEKMCKDQGGLCTYGPDVIYGAALSWIYEQQSLNQKFILLFMPPNPHDGYYQAGTHNGYPGGNSGQP